MSRNRSSSDGYSKSYQLEMVNREKGSRRKYEKEKEVKIISNRS